MARTIPRKIYFYGVHFGERHSPEPFEVTDRAFAKLRSLNVDSDNWYLPVGADRSICAWSDSDNPRRVTLGTVRWGGLPEVEDKGRRRPLPLEDHQNIVECTHVVLFEPGIVGAEFNFHGPRLHGLADVMSRQLGLPPLTIFPLLNQDIREKIRDVGEVKLLQVSIHKDYLQSLNQSEESIASAFSALEDISKAPVIEVIFRQSRHARGSLGSRARRILDSIAGIPDMREAMDKFSARAIDVHTGKTATFDFLRDAFVSVRHVVKKGARSRAIKSASMFEAIEEAYNDLRPQLLTASGLDLS